MLYFRQTRATFIPLITRSVQNDAGHPLSGYLSVQVEPVLIVLCTSNSWILLNMGMSLHFKSFNISSENVALFRALWIREWLYWIQLKSVLNLGLEVCLWKNLCNFRPRAFNEAIINFILIIASLKGTQWVEKKREQTRTSPALIPIFPQLFLVHCNFCFSQPTERLVKASIIIARC